MCGAKCVVPSIRCQICGAQICGAKSVVPKCVVPWCQICGAKCVVPICVVPGNSQKSREIWGFPTRL